MNDVDEDVFRARVGQTNITQKLIILIVHSATELSSVHFERSFALSNQVRGPIRKGRDSRCSEADRAGFSSA